MPTKSPSSPTLEEATAEAEEAAALVDALQERIRSGDATVKPADLSSAQSLAEFAALQREAAERRAGQINLQLITDEVDAVVEAARSLATSRFTGHERLRAEAEKAFVAYMDSVDAMSYAAAGILSRLRAVNLRATDAGLDTTAAAGVWELSGQLEVAVEDGAKVFPPERPDGRAAVAELADAAQIDAWLGGGDATLRFTSKRAWPPAE